MRWLALATLVPIGGAVWRAARIGAEGPSAVSASSTPARAASASCGKPSVPDSTARALEDAVRGSARRLEARVGVAALDVVSGAGFAVAGDEPVFLSSVVKLPVAVAVLRRVERGELALEDTLALGPRDVRPGHSPLAERHPAGARLTLGELLRAAVSESDNAASDALLRLAGGPGGVTAELREMDVDGVRVDRTYAQYFWDYHGVDDPPDTARWSPALFDSLGSVLPDAEARAATVRFAADVRDTGTPCGLASLAVRLDRQELLGRRSTQLLLGLMTRTANPASRIVAGLPPETSVAHKTGTWGSDRSFAAVNDVALVTLPDGRRLALAVLVEDAKRPLAEVDGAIADVTRAVYRAWPRAGN